MLLDALDLSHARDFLTPGATPRQWTQQTDHETNARWCLQFAIGKILHHRSSSASRSVDKLGEFAWLLGRDDVVSAMDTAGYPLYGAPKVQAFADGLGWPFYDAVDHRDDRRAPARMAGDEPCDPHGCAHGCPD